METFHRNDRLKVLSSLLPMKGDRALDVGCGASFPILYGARDFRSVLGINAHRPAIDRLRRDFLRPEWDFQVRNVREWAPSGPFDAITLLQ